MGYFEMWPSILTELWAKKRLGIRQIKRRRRIKVKVYARMGCHLLTYAVTYLTDGQKDNGQTVFKFGTVDICRATVTHRPKTCRHFPSPWSAVIMARYDDGVYTMYPNVRA